MKNKRIDFARFYKSIVANSLFQPFWNDFEDGLTLSLQVNSAKYIAR